jgi:hypothetical protein
MQTGENRMRPGFFAVQLVGAAISVVGVVCMAALPLPDYRWYNRLAVVVIMGFYTCLIFLADLWIHPPVDPVGFGLGSMGLGLTMIGLLYITLRTLPALYPEVIEARLLVLGVKLTPVGMMVQLVPSLLGLVGVHIW